MLLIGLSLSGGTVFVSLSIEERIANLENETEEIQRRTIEEYLNSSFYPMQKGSSLVLWAETDSHVLLGGDAIGEIRKSSEAVARESVGNLLDEVQAEATVDVHLADMLVPYLALARGESVFLVRTVTDHLESNIWLASKILGIDFGVERKGRLHRVAKR